MAKNNSSLWLPYTQMANVTPSLTPVHTHGTQIILNDGRTLIDGLASWWVACHGYNHPYLHHAIVHQLSALPHVMLGGLTPSPTKLLASRLAQKCPGDLNHVFFSESGSVSVDIALKMALQFWINQQQTLKTQFVYFQHAYHGDTFGAMSVCDPIEGMHHLFSSVLPKHYMQPLPDTDEKLDDFEQFIRSNHHILAGLIIEPLVQGAGGMKMHSPETLANVYHICKQYDVLFIADEIFTGFYRTGSLFACEQAQITPDIMCLSKALTGGMMPLAATIATTQIFESFLSEDEGQCFMHGPTYMGHALACSAANASCDLFEQEDYTEKVKIIEAYLTETLSPLTEAPAVKSVRIKGAIGCVELNEALHPGLLENIKAFFIEQGVWLRPFGNIIYCTPALTISHEHLKKITDTMKNAIKLMRI